MQQTRHLVNTSCYYYKDFFADTAQFTYISILRLKDKSFQFF